MRRQNLKPHPGSQIGQARAAVEDQQEISSKIERRIDEITAALEQLETDLRQLDFDVDVERVAEVLSDKPALEWLQTHLRNELMASRADETRLKQVVGRLSNRRIQAEEQLEQLDSPGVGWSEELKDLCRSCYNVRLHWLTGDPSQDPAILEQAEAARQEDPDSRNVLARERREELEWLEEQLQARGGHDGA